MPARYSPKIKPSIEITNELLQHLGQFHPLSKGLQQAFVRLIFEVKIIKGQHLLRKGEHSRYFYFLIQGVVTGYRNNGNKKMITFISVAGDFVTAIEGMYGLSPADENISAEDDCYLLALRSEHLLEFFHTFPEMNVIMRKVMERYYIYAHERSVIIRMGTAKEKYNYYLKTLPNHVDKVPEALVASFLNMKTETLIKIKKAQSQIFQNFRTDIGTEKLAKLVESMLTDKLYKQKKISIKSLAQHLNIGSHELSQLLNQVYQQNFADFINTHRVNFVKEQLKNKINFKLTTIEALGNQAGFSSKSTFFSAFKKQTDCSPLNYAKNVIV